MHYIGRTNTHITRALCVTKDHPSKTRPVLRIPSHTCHVSTDTTRHFDGDFYSLLQTLTLFGIRNMTNGEHDMWLTVVACKTFSVFKIHFMNLYSLNFLYRHRYIRFSTPNINVYVWQQSVQTMEYLSIRITHVLIHFIKTVKYRLKKSLHSFYSIIGLRAS